MVPERIRLSINRTQDELKIRSQQKYGFRNLNMLTDDELKSISNWQDVPALRAIYKSHPGGDAYPVYVSQDGTNAPVTDVVRRHGAHSLVHPRHTIALQRGTYLAKMPGYAYLSVHYGWALRTLFGMGRPGAPASKGAPYSGVIILEEDIEVAVDFFSYFTATAKLLDQDPTLLCVSAFNDNGCYATFCPFSVISPHSWTYDTVF